MEIMLNGQAHNCEKDINIMALVGELELDPRSIAVELNRQIVSKSLWQVTILKSGDKMEIVQFVGGG